MADMITRCPGCSVAFRASPAHLQAANGLVRCGACLNVFNAREHELRDEQNANTQQHTHTENDLLIHDSMDPETLGQAPLPETEETEET
ncbi:MAG: zinc-ribbon domain-containing protein, partial [Pseudomonadales bacterium]|nr:zinc-ribbon domain-containing protein [Pseudomonadales bacterium]